MDFVKRWEEKVKGLTGGLKDLGYERTRRAIALLPLAFFAIVYALVALQAPPGWGPALGGMALVYLVGFLAVGAEWFWGRWYASGLGWSGLMVGVYALVSVGPVPQLVVYTVLHAVTVVGLMGAKVAALYEQRPGWRERFGLDDYGVSKLGKTVTRAAGSLPALVLWALQPREGQGGGLAGLRGVALVAAALALAGLFEVLRLRTLGLIALVGAAVLALIAPALVSCVSCAVGGGFWASLAWPLPALAVDDLAGVWLAAAVVPFGTAFLAALVRRR